MMRTGIKEVRRDAKGAEYGMLGPETVRAKIGMRDGSGDRRAEHTRRLHKENWKFEREQTKRFSVTGPVDFIA